MSENQSSQDSSSPDTAIEEPPKKKMGRPPAETPPDLEAELLERQVLDYGVGSFELNDQDIKVMAVKIRYPKVSAAAIGRALGIPSKQVERSLANPEFNRRYKSYFVATADAMKDSARAAALRLRELIDSSDEKVALSAIRIALSPYIQQAKLHVEIRPSITFRTNVTASGNLVREVLEGEIQLIEEAINDDRASFEDDAHRVEEEP